MLVLLLMGPIAMAFCLKWLIPFFTDILSPYLDLRDYYSLIAGGIVLFIPMLVGVLIGFILLDERDDSVYLMLIVTPLGKGGYIIYRVLFPAFFSFIYSIIALPLVDIVDLSYITLISVAFLAAFGAPITALFLAGLANNKVEGLALSKGIGIFLLIPIASYFIEFPWRLIAGIVPYYWPVHSIVIGDPYSFAFWGHILLGLMVQALVMLWLIGRYERKAS